MRKNEKINSNEDVGFIVYWNNHSGHFRPNNTICESEFAKKYLPLELFCQVGIDGEHNYKKQNNLLQSFVDIEGHSLKASKKKTKKKKRKSKKRKRKRKKTKKRKKKSTN